MTNSNRETWLQAATSQLRPLFESAGMTLPDYIHLSIGFPSKMALSTKKRRIGECWSYNVSKDKNYHIFVSPLLSDAVQVLGTLVHELVHAAVGCDCGHKGAFVRGAKAVGLTGPWTATGETEELTAKLNDIINVIGPYPHGALTAAMLNRKKQPTRLIKVVCPLGCKSEMEVGKKGKTKLVLYSARMTQVHLDAFGAPLCGNCNERMVEEDAEREDED